MSESAWKGTVVGLAVLLIAEHIYSLEDRGRLTERVNNIHTENVELKRLVQTQAAANIEIRNRQIRVEVISEHMLKTLNKINDSMTSMNTSMSRNEGIIEAAKDHIRHK